jgi:hypothetical protein
VSLRVDLYPLSLEHLTALFRENAGAPALELAETLAREAPRLNQALLGQLLSGRLRLATMPVESAALAAIISQVAYRVRPAEPKVCFDVGAVWNAFDTLAGSLQGEEARLASNLLTGRPLIGQQIDSDWNAYAWVARWEFDVFGALLTRAEPVAGYDVSRVRPWLEQVNSMGLDVFVAVG